MRYLFTTLFIGIVLAGSTGGVWADDAPDISLNGSEESMSRQNRVARKLGLRFVQTPSEFSRMLGDGSLVALSGNRDYEVVGRVPYPYARPEMRDFIEKLAAKYHESTGEKLVVTSLTRPATRQPRNSHYLSVHPAGIAVDLRISSRRRSSQWLERELLNLERQGVLDVTRERRPPHFHVALFPDAYGDVEETRVEDSRVGAVVSVAPAEWDSDSEPLYEDAGPSEATLLGSLTDGDRDWLPLVVSLPLIGLVLGALGFRRKTRVLPSYPTFVPAPPPPFYEAYQWNPHACERPAYPQQPPQWQPLDEWPALHGDGAPYFGGSESAKRTARPIHPDNCSAVWHP